MKRFFKKTSKPYYLRSQKHLYQYSYVSIPKSKADACVSCDLLFDESKIAAGCVKEIKVLTRQTLAVEKKKRVDMR